MGRRIQPFTADMEIVDAASDGRAVARHGEKVVFVEKAVPGDYAAVHIFRKQKKMLVGRIESLHQASKDRVDPPCSHFGVCGGCKWQMMSYDAQLRFKQKHVEDAFLRIGKVDIGEVLPILGVENPYFYRNKLEFTFSNKAWLTSEQIESNQQFDQRVLGYHTARIFDKIIDIENCQLQLPIINGIRNEIRQFAREHNLAFYDIRENEGFLRNVMFRTSVATKELMLVLIVAEDDKRLVDRIFSHIEDKFPEITNFIWIHNSKKNSSFSELPFHVWKGEPYITESLGEFDFRISPTSFFQTNPKQAERLYGAVKDFLQKSLNSIEGSKIPLVYDLYSGTGSIGIYISDLVEKIVGIEYVQSSIDDAWKNVKLNGLSHFSFYAGDMRKILNEDLLEKEGRPQVIITDPPRAGMDAKVVARILEIAPEYIIYVSCKPATQARDVNLMKDVYEVLQIQPVDMFPQTAHVENIAWLKRKG